MIRHNSCMTLGVDLIDGDQSGNQIREKYDFHYGKFCMTLGCNATICNFHTSEMNTKYLLIIFGLNVLPVKLQQCQSVTPK